MWNLSVRIRFVNGNGVFPVSFFISGQVQFSERERDFVGRCERFQNNSMWRAGREKKSTFVLLLFRRRGSSSGHQS